MMEIVELGIPGKKKDQLNCANIEMHCIVCTCVYHNDISVSAVFTFRLV